MWRHSRLMGVPAQRNARRVEATESSAPNAVLRPPKELCPPEESSESTEPRVAASPELRRRVHDLVREHMDFVWRSLRRLGVDEPDCDDGCQRVWLVVASKADAIEPGKTKSFIFSVIMRVASDMRRSQRRHQPIEFDEHALPPGSSSGVVDAEALLEQQRGWRLLEKLLTSLSWELRTVFVMFELEGMTSLEIADALGLPRGTVASRLRLAREAFERGVQRYQVREQPKHGARRRRGWFT